MAPPETLTPGEIGVDELAARLDDADHDVVLIDVREVDEYRSGHVPGARLVVMGTVPDNVAAFQAGDQPAHVICRSGARSMRVCEYLVAQGVPAVNVTGGTMAWQQSGRPVVMGDRPS